MYLIQLFLPLFDHESEKQPIGLFVDVERELVEQFGGITTYSRAPAKGKWATDNGKVERDEIVIFEVMAEALDRAWWRQLRENLERRFKQERLIVRVSKSQLL